MMTSVQKRKLATRMGRTGAVALVIFVVTFSIFTISRVRQVADSNYSMLVSQSLLDHQSLALDGYAIPRHEPVWHGYYFKNGPIYQLELAQNHIYYHFPPGTSILSTPFVAVLNLIGVSPVNADGTYNARGEVKIEAGLAALLMAVLAVVFFFIARILLPLKVSALVSLGGALGTQVYSTASRAMWSETWGILLLGFVLLMLLAHETSHRRLQPIALASLLSWMFFVRPTFAIPVAAITVYLFLFHRWSFIRYALTGAVWFASFVAYSWYHFGHLLPSYYRAGRFGTSTFFTALAGNLISPARGLLVYVPILLFVGFLLIRYRRVIRFPRLVWLSLSVITGHLMLISGFPHWWGGHSFGPRFTTGLVPWFVLLAILGIDALRQSPNTRTIFNLQKVAGVAVLVVSVFINTLGATSHATWLWNQRPKEIDRHPDRLWDWRQPQFLAGYLPYPKPRELAALTHRIDFSDEAAERFLWYGWFRTPENELWAEREAAIVFNLPQTKPAVMRLNLNPFVVSGKQDSVKLDVILNDQLLTQLDVNAPNIYSLTLPSQLLRLNNTLTIKTADAKSPLALGVGEDARPRSINLRWIETGTEAVQIIQPGVQ